MVSNINVMAADFAISIKNLTCESKVVLVFHKHNTMKMYMGVEVYLLAIVTSALNGDGDRSGTVVKVLCYKMEGRWFDPIWCRWNFSLT